MTSPRARKALRLGLLFLAAGAATWADDARPLSVLAEFTAGPMIGIDRPLKGCAAALLLGMGLGPFELGMRAGGAYDAPFEAGLLRLDLELGLGSGLRAILGYLIPLGELALPAPDGAAGASLPLEPNPGLNRFGIASALVELPWRALRARMTVDAELVYTDYRLTRAAAAATAPLSGVAAFAAGVEGSLYLRLRWDGR